MRESRGNPKLAAEVQSKRQKKKLKSQSIRDHSRLCEMVYIACSHTSAFGRAILKLDLCDHMHTYDEFHISNLDKYYRG